MHTRYFIFFLLSIFFIPEIFAQDKILDRPEWKEFFDKHEATGTILIVDSRASAEKVSVYDRTRAGKRYSPASTFKVPHTLFALDAGVVKLIRNRFSGGTGTRPPACACPHADRLEPV